MSGKNALVALQDAALNQAVATRLRDDGARITSEETATDESLDILVVDAPLPPTQRFVGRDVASWYHEVHDALTRPFRIIRAAASALERSGDARVVVLGAGWSATRPLQGTAGAAVHGGVVALVKTLARDLGPRGITVNEVVVDPLAPASPEDVAAAVAYLAGPYGSAMVGQLVTIGSGGELRP